jgi:hypothetical protein
VNKNMTDKQILEQLNVRAHELTNNLAAMNDIVTAITVQSAMIGGVAVVEANYGMGQGTTFLEEGFSGCGSVEFTLPSNEWRTAKELGFKKGYRNWYIYHEYWNGQFGDACRAYAEALKEMKELYPDSILTKVQLETHID